MARNLFLVLLVLALPCFAGSVFIAPPVSNMVNLAPGLTLTMSGATATLSGTATNASYSTTTLLSTASNSLQSQITTNATTVATAIQSGTSLISGLVVAPSGTTLTLSGTVAVSQSSLITGTGSAPTVVSGSGIGSGGSVAVVGTNSEGEITLTAGTLPSISAVIVSGTFSNSFSFPTGSRMIIWPSSATSATLGFLPWVGSTTTGFTINAATVALAGSTVYKYNYQVRGN